MKPKEQKTTRGRSSSSYLW